MRAIVSFPPPGAGATTMRIGLAGELGPDAAIAATAQHAATAKRGSKNRFIALSPCRLVNGVCPIRTRCANTGTRAREILLSFSRQVLFLRLPRRPPILINQIV